MGGLSILPSWRTALWPSDGSLYCFPAKLTPDFRDRYAVPAMQLSSFLLVCIGVQIIWNGIKVLLESVTLHTA
jgi:hypothetical protein